MLRNCTVINNHYCNEYSSASSNEPGVWVHECRARTTVARSEWILAASACFLTASSMTCASTMPRPSTSNCWNAYTTTTLTILTAIIYGVISWNCCLWYSRFVLKRDVKLQLTNSHQSVCGQRKNEVWWKIHVVYQEEPRHHKSWPKKQCIDWLFSDIHPLNI